MDAISETQELDSCLDFLKQHLNFSLASKLIEANCHRQLMWFDSLQLLSKIPSNDFSRARKYPLHVMLLMNEIPLVGLVTQRVARFAAPKGSSC